MLVENRIQRKRKGVESMKTVADLIAAIAKGKGAKFAAFTYEAQKSGEVARHTIILGASTEVLYQKDIVALKQLLEAGTLTPLEVQAAQNILASRKTSLEVGIGNNPAYTCAGVYVHPDFAPGISVHIVNGAVYVRGLTEGKVIIKPGEYKPVNSAPLTIAKQKIEKGLPGGRFRLFRLPNVLQAKLNGETLDLG
jgi:hypothetical protein